MERLGSASHRNRHFNYVEQIRETAVMLDDDDEDQESKPASTQEGNPNGIKVQHLDSNDDFMRFPEGDGS